MFTNPTTNWEKPMRASVSPRKMAVPAGEAVARGIRRASWRATRTAPGPIPAIPNWEKLRFSSTLISGRMSLEKPEFVQVLHHVADHDDCSHVGATARDVLLRFLGIHGRVGGWLMRRRVHYTSGMGGGHGEVLGSRCWCGTGPHLPHQVRGRL